MWKLTGNDSRGDLIKPRSYCPSCKTPIKNIDLIPVIGFLALGGKCASCKASIPLRYPIVELLGGLSAIIAALVFGFTAAAMVATAYFLFLIALGFIDADTGYLPDALTVPLIALGLIANGFGLFTSWQNALIGAAVGYAAFRLIGEAFLRLRGVEGLGQGDAKLLAAIGAWLGWLALAPVVFAGALLALAAVATLRLTGTKVSGDTPIPFGPALAVAGALAMIANGLDLPSYFWR